MPLNRILNSIIHDNYDFSVLLFNAPYSIIANSVFYNNSVGIEVVNSSYVEIYNNIIEKNGVGVCIESPDIYDVGARLRALIRMWEKRKLPSRGATKVTVSDCRIFGNIYINIIVIGTNFVTIRNSDINNASEANIFAWQSILKVYNCTIYTSRVGIYVEECPVNTIIGNRIYNHSYAGFKLFKCVYTGVLYWIILNLLAINLLKQG